MLVWQYGCNNTTETRHFNVPARYATSAADKLVLPERLCNTHPIWRAVSTWCTKMFLLACGCNGAQSPYFSLPHEPDLQFQDIMEGLTNRQSVHIASR